jgi:hypothetical protein
MVAHFLYKKARIQDSLRSSLYFLTIKRILLIMKAFL